MQQDPDPPHRDLDSLPLPKRRELELIHRILFESFEEATRTKLKPERRRGRILAVLLFGSQARGTAVDSMQKNGYVSDYDILVVVDHEDLIDSDYWEAAEDRLSEMHLRRRIGRVTSIIFHSLQDVNDQLARGRYFFIDIFSEAIPLYRASGFAFAEPQPLTPEVAYEEALGYFEDRLPSAAISSREPALSPACGI